MEEKITLCGDNCLECPRYHAQSTAELENLALLWYKIGWRDTVAASEEMRCTGCSSHKACTYGLVACTKAHNVEKCNQCAQFPCEKIRDMLKRSEAYQKKCRQVCTREEYALLEKAFFHKERNLQK